MLLGLESEELSFHAGLEKAGNSSCFIESTCSFILPAICRYNLMHMFARRCVLLGTRQQPLKHDMCGCFHSSMNKHNSSLPPSASYRVATKERGKGVADGHLLLPSFRAASQLLPVLGGHPSTPGLFTSDCSEGLEGLHGLLIYWLVKLHFGSGKPAFWKPF